MHVLRVRLDAQMFQIPSGVFDLDFTHELLIHIVLLGHSSYQGLALQWDFDREVLRLSEALVLLRDFAFSHEAFI